jgi:GntR family transcriptional repressor for pyruvate dehydrogenase complex
MRHRTTTSSTPTIDEVFDALLQDIISGRFSTAEKLPSERDLCCDLGVSRPTLREALRRLEAWNLIVPRPGAGVLVRPYRDWSLQVLATYLRVATPAADQPSLSTVLADTLALRRGIIIDIVQMAALRLPQGGTHAARVAAARATAHRERTYGRGELDVLRAIVEAADCTPGLWLINLLGDERLAGLWPPPPTPADYRALYAQFFDLIDAGRPGEAVAVLRDDLERRDTQSIQELEECTRTTTLQRDARSAQ